MATPTNSPTTTTSILPALRLITVYIGSICYLSEHALAVNIISPALKWGVDYANKLTNLVSRKPLREPKLDTELAYAYGSNDELYQAAKLLFTSISNWAHLATTLSE